MFNGGRGQVPAAQGGKGPPIIPKPKAPQRANVYVPPASIGPHVTSPRPGAPPTHTDITSSGANYGSGQASRFKQTPQYRQAVQQVFRAQPTSQKAAIISGLLHHQNPYSLPEFHAVRSVWDHLSVPEQSKIVSTIPHDIGRFISPETGSLGSLLSGAAKGVGRLLEGIPVGSSPTGQSIARSAESRALGGGPLTAGIHLGKGISGALGGIEQGLNVLQPPQQNRLQSAAGVSAGGLGRLVTHVPIDVARAAAEKPAVIPATAKGLGEVALGAIPGLIEAGMHPGKTVNALVHDYESRYGPAAQGNDRALINRIKQSPQGAAPEALDILGVVGGADATLGRAATGLAKTREALTGKPNFLTRERPGLRVAGGTTRPQQLAHGAGKITAQRAEDLLRRSLAHRNEIQPRPHEVVPVFGRRAQRIEASRVVARNRELSQQALNQEVRARKSAQGAVNRLNKQERKAFMFAVEGGIPLRSGPQAAREWIDRHIAIIQHDRASPESLGNRIAPQHGAQIDDLRKLQDLRANVDKWLTPRLAAAVDKEGARRIKIDQMAVKGGAIQPATAEARALRPQGELLGIRHPDEAVAEQLKQLKQHQSELQARIASLTEAPKPEQGPRGFPARTASGRELQQQLGTYEPRTPSGRALAAQIEHVDAGTTLQAIYRNRQTLKQVQDNIKILEHPESRQALLEGYSKQVRIAAEKHGLPAEPGFLHHQPHPKIDFGAHTTGTGHRAMPPVQQSEFKLWRAGTLDRSPEAYVNGLAHSIKRPFQWRLTDEQMRHSALPRPSVKAVEAALGKPKKGPLTLFELKQAMLHEGANMDHVMFYRPGRLKASTLADLRQESLREPGTGNASAPAELETNAHIAEALKQNDVIQPGSANVPAEYRDQTGWVALPRAAYDEIHSSLQPSGRAGRIFGKVQGLNAMAILGGSPSFVVMNSLADALVAGIGTRGKLLKDALDYPIWAHKLSDEDRAWFKAHTGGRAGFRPEKMGSTARSQLVRQWRDLRQRGLFRAARAANPIRALFHGQAAFSDFMRHAVMFSEMKHMALQNIGKEMGQATRALEMAHQMFRFGPTRRVEQQLKDILGSQPAIERAGQHTLNIMGDYTRFTAFERKYLNNRAILFYSFLRYASRTLFYTLPLHHPIITAMVGELSKLHGDEVRKLLGGQDLPWAYSRLFFDHGGKLTSIDTLRSSPVGSVGTDIATRGIQGISQSIFPEAQILLNQIYGTQPTGAKYPRGVFSALNDILSLSYPYRAGSQLHFGLQPQQADSIPFIHERADVKKSASAQAYQQAKEQASGPLKDKMLSGLLGVWPKPDNSRVVAQHAAQKASKGSGGNLFGGSGGSQGSGNVFQQSSGGSSGNLFGSPSQGGAEGMRPAAQGGKLLGAVQYVGGAAVNAATQIAQQVGQQQRLPAPASARGITAAQARKLSPEAFYQAWKGGKLQGQRAAPAPSQLKVQQQGNAKMLAHLINPKVPFGFLQRGPAWAQKVRTPGGTGKAMQAVIGLANTITSHHYNYEWGGGHGQIGVPGSGTGHGSGPGVGFDCSGAVSAILHAAGVLNQPLVAAEFMSYGQPGPGTSPNDVTIYASTGHVVSQIGGRFFGTSSAHNPGGGADWFNASPGDYPGYAIRHVSLPAGMTTQKVAARIPQAAKWMVANLPAPVQKVLAKRAVQQGQSLPGGVAAGQKLGGKPLPQNVTPTVFAAATLNGLGVKPTPNNVQALTAWMAAEGGHWNNQAKYNPLNTKQPEAGSASPAGFASPGIKAYSSWNSGVKATIDTLHNGLYGGILQALKSPNVSPQALSAAVAASPWGTGGFSTTGTSVTPAQAAALAKLGPLSSTVTSGGGALPSSNGGASLPAGTATVPGGGGGSSAGTVAATGLAQNMLTGASAATGTPLDQQSAQLLQQAQQQASSLLSSYLGQSNPWNIGPKSAGFGGSGVNLNALGALPSGSGSGGVLSAAQLRRLLKVSG